MLTYCVCLFFLFRFVGWFEIDGKNSGVCNTRANVYSISYRESQPIIKNAYDEKKTMYYVFLRYTLFKFQFSYQ